MTTPPIITAPLVCIYKSTILENPYPPANYTGLFSKLKVNEFRGEAVVLADGPFGDNCELHSSLVLPFKTSGRSSITGPR